MDKLLFPEEPPPQPAASTLKAPAAIVVRTVLCHMFLTPKVDTMFKGSRHCCMGAGPGSGKRGEGSSVDNGFMSSNNDRRGTPLRAHPRASTRCGRSPKIAFLACQICAVARRGVRAMRGFTRIAIYRRLMIRNANHGNPRPAIDQEK